MEDKKPAYVKQMKNWIVVMSSVSMMINLYLSSDFVSILLSSFTYISSQGLAFYAINPTTDTGNKRRDKLISASIALIAFILICLFIESKIQLGDILLLVIFNGIKLIITIFCFYVVYCSCTADSESKTQIEKEISRETRTNLQKDYIKEKENNIFSERNSRKKNNAETRKFILNKKKIKQN